MNQKNKEINEICLFNKVKCKYLLKQIFNTLKRTKCLNYIRYSKNIQNKLDINSADYLNEYSKIVLEIKLKPIEDQIFKFINTNKNYQPYCHFYFDDNPIDVKRNYITKNEKIGKILIIIDDEIKSFERLFEQRKYIKEINFLRFNRKDIKQMNNMFSSCSSLEIINLSRFKTDNVSNMSYMFYGCSSLKQIDLSNFQTHESTNMSYMFSECTSLKTIDLSNFNTSKVINMKGMFCGCSSLEKVNLTNFNTNIVSDMSQMFKKCLSLKQINLSNFNTSEVENMCEMFQECSSLKELNLSNFKINKIILMNYIFGGCSSLEKLNISNFNTQNIFFINCRLTQTKFSYIFTNIVEPIKLILKMSPFSCMNYIPNFNNPLIIGMINIFDQCFSLKDITCNDSLIMNEFAKLSIK